ncbi:MAG TPA: acyl-ACP--UDP-N-acetylglucosamine O-acyltransferase [Nevskiales bacterium]|nr:acyl-ACP--UDP-N-acetylglucosamine O-acyltransferase [Nevskiales bacterium]
MIDPRAVVHPEARLGRNVSVGAYSLIGAGVEIGDNTWIGPHVVINGPTRIGHSNRIFQFCSIGEEPQHRKYAGEPTRLEIGDRNIIREYCSFHRGTTVDQGVTRVGSDNYLMAHVHVAHDCVVGSHITMANNATLAGHVQVGDHCILGGYALVHQFCRIGTQAYLGFACAVAQDVPPYVMANGNPAVPHGINTKGLKARGFSTAQIEALRKAYKVLYRSDLLFADARRELARMGEGEPVVRVLADFLNDSKRSIIR